MKPATYNIELEQGSTLTREFTFTAFDLSIYDTARMQIRLKPGSTTAIWDSEAHDGSVTIEGNNKIVVDIPAHVTSSFAFDEAGYDIELVINAAVEVVDKPLKGKIVLSREHTK